MNMDISFWLKSFKGLATILLICSVPVFLLCQYFGLNLILSPLLIGLTIAFLRKCAWDFFSKKDKSNLKTDE